MRKRNYKIIPAPVLLTASLIVLFSCHDLRRDNLFDPDTEVLDVKVLSPPDSGVFYQGDRITFQAEAVTGFDNQPAGESFTWSSNISGHLSSASEFSTDSLPPGTHGITVVVTDSENRRGSEFIRITVYDVPDYAVRIKNPPCDTLLLVGHSMAPSVIEYVPAGFTIMNRLWDFGVGSGIESSTLKDPGTVDWNQGGNFQLQYQMIDILGRPTADTVLVRVLTESERQSPVVNIISPPADTIVYLGDSLDLRGSDTEGTVRIIEREWLYPAGSGLETLEEDTTAAPGRRTFMQTGTFEIVYQVTDLWGFSASDTVSVTVNDLPPAAVAEILSPARDTTITLGDSLLFKGHYTPEDAPRISQAWDYGSGSGIDASADTLSTAGLKLFAALGEFRVTFTVSDDWGRSSIDSVLVTVVAIQPPEARITIPPSDTTITPGDSLEFAAEDSDPDGLVVSRLWTWGAGSGIDYSPADTTANPGKRAFVNMGIFEVLYTVIDDDIARAIDTVVVTVDTLSN